MNTSSVSLDDCSTLNKCETNPVVRSSVSYSEIVSNMERLSSNYENDQCSHQSKLSLKTNDDNLLNNALESNDCNQTQSLESMSLSYSLPTFTSTLSSSPKIGKNNKIKRKSKSLIKRKWFYSPLALVNRCLARTDSKINSLSSSSASCNNDNKIEKQSVSMIQSEQCNNELSEINPEIENNEREIPTNNSNIESTARDSNNMNQQNLPNIYLPLDSQISLSSSDPELVNSEDSPRNIRLFLEFLNNSPLPTALKSYLIHHLPPKFHTQVDYVNHLVPDLLAITNSSFYWGKMNRYQAERLLNDKPEGTFLLRDSAQDNHVFSVSFRRFNRSLHARIEQNEHYFSFDSHDPGVFSSSTIMGLVEHYKDPSHCMFFEPILTKPLNRNFAFTLQHLCRATICDQLSYNSINKLPLPSILKSYLKEYHYSTALSIRKFDEDHSYYQLSDHL